MIGNGIFRGPGYEEAAAGECTRVNNGESPGWTISQRNVDLKQWLLLNLLTHDHQIVILDVVLLVIHRTIAEYESFEINIAVIAQLIVVTPQKGGRSERREVAFGSDTFLSTFGLISSLIHRPYSLAS